MIPGFHGGACLDQAGAPVMLRQMEADVMAEVFMVHGSYGSPEENWFPWLKAELEKAGCWVYVPRFPTPQGQSLASWTKVFDSFEGNLRDEVVFIGHSVGCAFVLSVLESLKRPAKAAFLVAGWTGSLGIPRFDTINKSFTERQFDWEKIKAGCRRFHVYASDDDPYVPFTLSAGLAKKLGAPVSLVKRAGHFNDAAGCKRFEVLLGDVMETVRGPAKKLW